MKQKWPNKSLKETIQKSTPYWTTLDFFGNCRSFTGTKWWFLLLFFFFLNSKFENTFCLSPFGRCPSACCIVFFITIHFLRCIGVKAFQRSEALGTTPHNFISPAAISSFWLVYLFFFFFEVGAHVSQLDAFRRFVLRLGSKLSAIKETKKKNNKTVWLVISKLVQLLKFKPINETRQFFKQLPSCDQRHRHV